MIDGSSEDPDLAEEHCDQKRGAGRVGGGGQQVRHPGGHCEHGCGNKVDKYELPRAAGQIHLESNH